MLRPVPAMLVPTLALVLAAAGCGRGTVDQPRSAEAKTPAQAVQASTVGRQENVERVLRTLPKGTTPYQEQWPNGQPRASGFMCDHTMVGPWVYGYASGARRCAGTYLYGGIQDGEWSYWTPGGRLSMRGAFVRGKEHGPWTYWHDNGHEAAAGTYYHGERVGEWTTWHAGGGVASRGRYIAGAMSGAWTYWGEDGTRLDEVMYRPGATVPTPLAEAR